MRNVILCFAPWATLISTKVLLTCPSFTNRLLRLPARGVPSFCQDRYPHFFPFTIYWTILWHFEPGDTEIVRFPWIQMTKNTNTNDIFWSRLMTNGQSTLLTDSTDCIFRSDIPDRLRGLPSRLRPSPFLPWACSWTMGRQGTSQAFWKVMRRCRYWYWWGRWRWWCWGA